MNVKRLLAVGTVAALAAAGAAFGMSQGNGNGPPPRVAYLKVVPGPIGTDPVVDPARTSPGVTISPFTSFPYPDDLFCVNADFEIVGGSATFGPIHGLFGPGLALRGDAGASGIFDPGQPCEGFQAFVRGARTLNVYVVLLGRR